MFWAHANGQCLARGRMQISGEVLLEAIEHRLCRKFRERRDELMGDARKRAQKRKEEDYIFLRDFSKAFAAQLQQTEEIKKQFQKRAEEMTRPLLEMHERMRQDEERLLELSLQKWRKAFGL